MEESGLSVFEIPEVNEINYKVTPTSLGLVTFCLFFSCLYKHRALTYFPRLLIPFCLAHNQQYKKERKGEAFILSFSCLNIYVLICY